MSATGNHSISGLMREASLIAVAMADLTERGLKAVSFTGSRLKTAPEIQIEEPDTHMAAAGVCFMTRHVEKSGRPFRAEMYQAQLYGCRIVWVKWIPRASV